MNLQDEAKGELCSDIRLRSVRLRFIWYGKYPRVMYL